MNVKYFITGTGNDEDDIIEFSMIFLDSERKPKNETIWDGFVYFITEYDDPAYAFYPVYANSLQYAKEITEPQARELCPGMFYWVDKYITNLKLSRNH